MAANFLQMLNEAFQPTPLPIYHLQAIEFSLKAINTPVRYSPPPTSVKAAPWYPEEGVPSSSAGFDV